MPRHACAPLHGQPARFADGQPVTPLGNDHGVKILAQAVVRRPDMRFFRWRGPVTQMWRQTQHLASHQPVSRLCFIAVKPDQP